VFKKGVELLGRAPSQIVHAVAAGKVVFAGSLPTYGQVTIVDHGEHFYSLSGQLGKMLLKTGDAVRLGDAIGETDASGRPLYFEIRSRNVAVNPLQWFGP
jgi:septal ring factor EnvC (AmiA/AmiB activator)